MSSKNYHIKLERERERELIESQGNLFIYIYIYNKKFRSHKWARNSSKRVRKIKWPKWPNTTIFGNF